VVIVTGLNGFRTERDPPMLVLHTRTNEKILFPDADTSIEVVAIQAGSVRLAIRAPEDTRVVRENAQEPPAEPVAGEAPSMPMLRRLLEKRLEIAREGIDQARQKLRAGLEEDARVLMEKVDEDLHLLRRRIRREFDKAEALSCGI
jgi:carbon storage regulator CsrA